MRNGFLFGAASLLIVAAICPVWAQPGVERPGGTAFTLRVVDRSGRSDAAPVFLACSANGWNPGDPEWELSKADTPGEGGHIQWSIRVPGSVFASGSPLEFKFTKGSWNTVEVDAHGGDIANRALASKSREGPWPDVTVSPIEGFADQRGSRWPELTPPGTAPKPTVVGDLDILDVHSSVLNNDRKVRVWLPPGYKDGSDADARYPVLYMHDGQNCFDAATSAFGVEWGCDEAMTALVKAGKVRPWIIVGIDNALGDRAREYNPPYTSFQGRTNHGDKYLAFVTDELMPLINSRYRTLTGPEHAAMGGSSFGGNATAYAAIEKPGMFGRVLIESAAMFIDEGKLLKRAEAFDQWPARVFLGVGTAETAGAGDAERFAGLTRDLGAALRAKGLGDDRLRVVIEDGAKHNEAAWAKRLPGAFEFLFAP